jgi:hypothetical protein
MLLEAPRPPMQLCVPPTHEETMTAEMRIAIAQAQHGNSRLLDAIECRYLNLLARIGELVVRRQDGSRFWWFSEFPTYNEDEHAPFVVGLERDGETRLLEWSLVEKCRRCDGKLRRLPCRVCGGDWHVADTWDDHVYTDVNGVIVWGYD